MGCWCIHKCPSDNTLHLSPCHPPLPPRSKEKHELEEQRQQLLEEVQSYKKKIRQLEDDLLFRLSNSQGRL